MLVGLAVHRHQRLGDLGQRGHRHRCAAHERARPALGRQVAGQHDPVVLDLAAGLVHLGGERVRPASWRRRDHTLDPRLAGAGADRAAVGAAAEEQARGR